ncbi:MAG: putative nucleic acid-binding Zn-ribbon protein [Alteromonas naphthalenivorans]|jgi:predicted  nucleic acid-binding Zn-ribbon protein
MSKSPFDLFIDLITFDQILHKKEKEIIHLEGEIELIEDQLELSKKQFVEEKKALYDLRKNVDMQELEMKTLDEKAKKVQERYSIASNNREYIALKSETEDIQNEQMAAEEKLIAVWNTLENAQKNVEKQEKEIHGQTETLLSEINEKQEKVDELEEKLQAETKGRQDKEIGIPEEWLEKYARMRNLVIDPVASVEDQSCKSCFHVVTNQEMAQLQRKKLLQCKGCYRFLYLNYATEVEESNGG